MKSRFNVVSTFAGCGGSSLGYKLAGGKVLLAVEWDDNAAETYNRNHPDTPLFHGDIATLSVSSTLARANLQPGELDILDGSPPCQGFSVVGKRDLYDSRNQLFREYVRLLEGLLPKVFVMENVAGMVKGKMRLIFAEIMRTLRGAGYHVAARLMNTMYFNVPQSRPRLIIIGVRDDLSRAPSHPVPQAVPITFRQACGDLRGNAPEDRMLGEVVRRVALLQPDKWRTDIKIYRYFKGNTASAASLQWIGWDRVCGTLVKSEISLSGLVHPDRKRYISLAEAKRVSSFPDDFWFRDRESGIMRMGNCVPPNFMKAIAEHIYQHILA